MMSKPTAWLVAGLIVAAIWTTELGAYPQFSKTNSMDIVKNLDVTSPAVARARARLAQAESVYSGAKAIPNPHVFGSKETVAFPEGDETETAYGVSQELSFIWESVPEIRSQAAALQAARARYDIELAEIQIDVLTGFSQLASLNSQRELADTVLVVLEVLTEQAAGRRVVGESSEFDLSRFEAETVQLRQTMLAQNEEYWRELAQLTELTGVSKDELLKVENDETPPLPFGSAAGALNYARENSPELHAARAESKAAKLRLSASRWAMIPDVSIGAGKKEVSGGFSGPTVELDVELPLFGQGRRFVKEAAAEERVAGMSESSAQGILETEIEGVFSQLSLFDEKLQDLDSPKRTLRQTVMLYDEGEITTLETVDALRSLLESHEARATMETSRLELILRLYRLCGKSIVNPE